MYHTSWRSLANMSMACCSTSISSSDSFAGTVIALSLQLTAMACVCSHLCHCVSQTLTPSRPVQSLEMPVLHLEGGRDGVHDVVHESSKEPGVPASL